MCVLSIKNIIFDFKSVYKFYFKETRRIYIHINESESI